MSRGRTAAVIGVGVVAVAAAVLAVVFGVVGVGRTITAGTQPTVCGTTLGVTSADDSVRFPGVSDNQYAVGERVRLSPLCVVEVVGIDAAPAVSDDEDGAGARVQIRWRLW